MWELFGGIIFLGFMGPFWLISADMPFCPNPTLLDENKSILCVIFTIFLKQFLRLIYKKPVRKIKICVIEGVKCLTPYNGNAVSYSQKWRRRVYPQ